MTQHKKISRKNTINLINNDDYKSQSRKISRMKSLTNINYSQDQSEYSSVYFEPTNVYYLLFSKISANDCIHISTYENLEDSIALHPALKEHLFGDAAEINKEVFISKLSDFNPEVVTDYQKCLIIVCNTLAMFEYFGYVYPAIIVNDYSKTINYGVQEISTLMTMATVFALLSAITSICMQNHQYRLHLLLSGVRLALYLTQFLNETFFHVDAISFYAMVYMCVCINNSTISMVLKNAGIPGNVITEQAYTISLSCLIGYIVGYWLGSTAFGYGFYTYCVVGTGIFSFQFVFMLLSYQAIYNSVTKTTVYEEDEAVKKKAMQESIHKLKTYIISQDMLVMNDNNKQLYFNLEQNSIKELFPEWYKDIKKTLNTVAENKEEYDSMKEVIPQLFIIDYMPKYYLSDLYMPNILYYIQMMSSFMQSNSMSMLMPLILQFKFDFSSVESSKYLQLTYYGIIGVYFLLTKFEGIILKSSMKWLYEPPIITLIHFSLSIIAISVMMSDYVFMICAGLVVSEIVSSRYGNMECNFGGELHNELIHNKLCTYIVLISNIGCMLMSFSVTQFLETNINMGFYILLTINITVLILSITIIYNRYSHFQKIMKMSFGELIANSTHITYEKYNEIINFANLKIQKIE